MAMAVLVIAGAGPAGAKPPASVPVSITLKSKEVTPFGCPELCLKFYGAVRSPKPACTRNRVLTGDLRIRFRGATETSTVEYFAEADGQGKFDTITALLDGQRILWVVVSVPKERIGGVLCGSASAKITL